MATIILVTGSSSSSQDIVESTDKKKVGDSSLTESRSKKPLKR